MEVRRLNGMPVPVETVERAKKAASLFPLEVRRQVADLVFPNRPKPSGVSRYVCEEGRCIVSALVYRIGGRIIPLQPSALNVLHMVQFLNPPGTPRTWEQERAFITEMGMLMSMNDMGVFSTPEAVRYVLLWDEDET